MGLLFTHLASEAGKAGSSGRRVDVSTRQALPLLIAIYMRK